MSIKFSPLTEVQLKALQQLTAGIQQEQITWLNGYFQGLAGSVATGSATEVRPEEQPAEAGALPLTILYGTHTGRSEALAKALSQKAAERNIKSVIKPMDDYKTKQLKDEKNLLVIVSTHGEGEPPEMAEDFYFFLTGKRVPKLDGLNYSVLALGDKSYKLFCQTGVDMDLSLSKAGAKPLLPIVKCDVDYEDDAEKWGEAVLAELAKQQPNASSAPVRTAAKSEVASYSKKNPFAATVLDKVQITGRDSDKEVYHLELSLEGSGITYEPGDALGVIAQNPPQLVDDIIATLGVIDQEVVETRIGKLPFNEALKHHYEVTLLTRDVIEKYAEKTGIEAVKAILEDDKKLDDYLYGHDVLDLLHEFPFKLTATEFLELLRPLPPRLYSISSSQEAVEDEVHITVSRVRYENKGRKRYGACSTFLADRLQIDDEVLIYIDKNPNFRLPQNGTPIIMVGAGTGIAPYRAFLQQRESAELKGKSWLFFGERHFASDFLYQLEWQKYLQKGFLEKIDLAFSRDQKEKVYVQHKLLEQQKELFDWINNGAIFYLCGDMKYMARDVQAALLEIIQTQGGMTEEQAKAYFKKLKKEKRFMADVY
ncbi:assimilatory sulfite reductase (NADPH) flavoprotein subunit [Sunxiuqinia elliptica]|uniref:assimilatory sulfite reductase (NADPH) n=1 Tax=Sunxiuqinia elliptica TaxID=655355 RepID=A0A4R6GUI2_9BACT|nr:assimilatory sulfite reductase (NADPH) flavoprotein subunit [Sunxiuqinia elliptica]TDN98344.1 sulfite reductase (NADPH) alpha subunit [Sunxiuqinia elliptica]TDO60449.1 sulfite reductase (NADPH) alpha subunit [Sunxiuqinia elliptica]